MGLLVTTDTRLKKLRPHEIQDQHFESDQYGTFQVVSEAKSISSNSNIEILTTWSNVPQTVEILEVFNARLMVEL